MLIGLFPELDAPGGVQRAGRHLAAVLTEFASSRGMDCRLLSLNDSPELHRMTLGGREFVFTGCDRAKGRFTVTALRAARRKAKLVLAAHPNLGPVVQAMRIAAPRMKSIICTHGIDVWEPLGVLRRRALRHANLVLAPSRDTAEHVASEQGVARERIRVLPWALDPQFEGLLAA
ncbi:MAG TPA: glycosyltransferase family 4 protein, partial [Candidatus Acidoferrum sp.]|nr:glycosyltransferase family 4 protein [Candidatus Acidoferrum sp.]